MHINVAAKFSSLPRKYSPANRGKNHKGVLRLLPQQFVKDLNQMLNKSKMLLYLSGSQFPI